jgi:hypothetical protein
MRRFRQLCAAIALACILAVSGSAGDISCGIAHPAGDMSCGLVHESPAESQQSAGDTHGGATGERPNGVESTDPLTET